MVKRNKSMQYQKPKLELSQSQLPNGHPAKKGNWVIRSIKNKYFLISEDNNTILIYYDKQLTKPLIKINPVRKYIILSRKEDDSVYALGVFYTDPKTKRTRLLHIHPDGSFYLCRNHIQIMKVVQEYYDDNYVEKGLQRKEYKSTQCFQLYDQIQPLTYTA